MLSINTNLSSLIAQSSMKTSTNKLNQAIERMSTGFKINHASDNAANYSIATNMTTKINSYMVAEDNAAMGLDLISTAEGTLSQIQDKLSRLRALAEQSANGTYGAQSKQAINQEANALVDEIERLYSTAEYNGLKLFDSDDVNPITSIAMFAMARTTEGNNYFLSDPVTYTDEEVEAMTKVADVDTFTSGQKYSISTAEELQKLANYVNSHNDTTGIEFVLGADIDLSSISNWVPIGNDDHYPFRGTFDGNGHTITNLTIDSISYYYNLGFFGTAVNATIKNVGLVGEINDTYGSSGNTGGLVGSIDSCSITNCFTKIDVSSSGRVGGLVGYCNSSSSTISNCYTTGNVSGSSYVGGLIGFLFAGTISSCYTTGSASGSAVGGLVGSTYYYGFTVSNSYSTGTVSGSAGSNSLNSSTDWDGTYFTATCLGNTIPTAEIKSQNQASLITLQVGITSIQNSQISINTKFSLSGIEDLRVIGLDLSTDYLEQVDALLAQVSIKQTEYGAVSNRLESVLEEITIQRDNLISSRSTIRDADIAEVSSHYIQQQILQQASATLLATANQSPSIALQLI